MQWRRQFGFSHPSAGDDGGGQIVATEDGRIVAATAQALPSEERDETKARLERLRGGRVGAHVASSHGSSLPTSPPGSASPSWDLERAVLSPVPGEAHDLLRRIERHFDTNGKGHLDDREMQKVFDALDADADGVITEVELRRGLEKVFAQPVGGTSEDARHFKRTAEWSGTVSAIESATPAQYHARKIAVDLDDGSDAPMRPSIARLSLTGDQMMHALEHQRRYPPTRTASRTSSRSGTPPRSPTLSPTLSLQPARPPPQLSLTPSDYGPVRTASGVSPRVVADEVTAGRTKDVEQRRRDRDLRRAAEDRCVIARSLLA